MSAQPSYPELYFCLRALLLPPSSIPPTRSYKSYSAPTTRRLTGVHSLKLIWPRFKLMKVSLLLCVCVLNTSAICQEKKDFALFTVCLERRSQLREAKRYVRAAPAFKLSWRRGRDAAHKDHRRRDDGEDPSFRFTFCRLLSSLLTTVCRLLAYVTGQTSTGKCFLIFYTNFVLCLSFSVINISHKIWPWAVINQRKM